MYHEKLLTLDNVQAAAKLVGRILQSRTDSDWSSMIATCFFSSPNRFLNRGTISENLGPGKSFFNKMSMKAKADMDKWAEGVQNGEATCHYRSEVFARGSVIKCCLVLLQPRGLRDSGTSAGGFGSFHRLSGRCLLYVRMG